jgi:hypothetical protein
LKRTGRSVLAATVSTGLSGCGGPAFGKAFNQAFDKSTSGSRMTSAIAHQAAPNVAEKYGACLVGQLSSLSVQEKQNLNNAPEKPTAAANVCKAQLQ